MIQIKTFRAKSLQLALAQVREALGPDAAVLSTRDVRAGLFGLGPRVIEVTASTSIQVPSRMPSLPEESSKVEAETTAPHHVPNKAATKTPEPAIKRQTDQLESLAKRSTKEIGDLKFTVAASKPASVPTVDPRHVEIMNEMLQSGMDPTWARHLLHLVQQSLAPAQWEDPLMVRGKLAHWVQSQLSIASPIEVPQRDRPYVVAMVGPTGVGKTTTLAKLAAGFTLEEKIPVGLITIDTFRIGAVDQLRRYAEIMNLPMTVVESEEEMKRSLEQLSACKIIFIDTAGRTPRDTSQLDQLKRMLQVAQADEIQLVLSSTTSPGSFQDALHRYSTVQPNRMVLSKLDEVRGLGELFPMLRQSKLPISYVTTGQNVPKDIEPAAKTRLAAFMLGQATKFAS